MIPELSTAVQTTETASSRPAALARVTREQAAAEAAGDMLNLSDAAREVYEPSPNGIRTDLVMRIRQELADGTYTLDDKTDKVIDGLLRDLRT